MPQAAVATKVHQSLDVHGEFTTQVTLHHHVAYFGAKSIHLLLRQRTDFHVFSNAGGSAEAPGLTAAYTIDICQ